MYLPLVFYMYIWFLYFHIQCKGKKCRERLAFTASLQMFGPHRWNWVQLYQFIDATSLHWDNYSNIYHIIVITVHNNFPYNLIQVFKFPYHLPIPLSPLSLSSVHFFPIVLFFVDFQRLNLWSGIQRIKHLKSD